ncbi:hypothetical protein J5N97_003830 [Dioscorea zingiberensis]|uniref:Agenet domain-containing protein n=1 Tax=Dioscorea zingiberensis TaxID=325984 RepID=A0A9D5HQT7_9LILI|nr:hypothetical protein J5N97_003830 [Dioscorea zingiberensis]
MGKSGTPRRKQIKTRGFSVGDQVEVQSEDEGFRGAWYEATVVRPFPKHRRHSVVYASLLEDRDSSRPLREYVLDSHLRPRHPRRPGPPFQIHQLVEAFHQDGWWPGVVADVRGGRYAVCFPSTREEEEFVESEVRAHLQWVKGQWVSGSQDEQGRSEAKFGVGNQVEVTRDKEIFGATWYVGTVLKVIGKTYFLIEYPSLLRDRGCGGHPEVLREIVDAQYIRPSLPLKPESEKFDLFDEVEAFCTNYWLPGVVTKVLSESKYVVKPTYQEDELEFSSMDLRLHYNWINGHWVGASQKECRKSKVARINKSFISRRKPQAGKMPDFTSSVSTTSDGEITLDMCSDTSILKQEINRKLRLDDQLGSAQPCNESRKKELVKDNTKLVDLLPIERRSKISEKIGMQLDSSREVEISPSQTNEDPHSKGLHRERKGESSSVVSKLPPNMIEVLCEQGMAISNDTAKTSCLEPKTYNPTDDIPENKSKVLNLILSPSVHERNDFFSGSEWENYSGVSDSGLNLKKRRKKLVVRAPKRQRKITDVVRPAPPGFVAKRGLSPNEGKRVKQVEITADQAVEIERGKKEAEHSEIDLSGDVLDAIQLSCFNHGAGQNESSPLVFNGGDLQGENVIHGSKEYERFDCYNQPHDKHVTSQFNSSSIVEASLNDPSTQQMSVVMVSSSNCGVEGVHKGNEANVGDDNQSLSPLEEDTLTVQEDLMHNWSSSKRTEMEIVSEKNSSSQAEKNALVAFNRKSPMWETVKSMEVFSLMPQEPHFQPLEQYCQELREGMAVGLMVTFANFATSIRNLQITDPPTVFDDKLKALASLEAYGFEVQRMRSRIKQLLEIKRNQNQSEIKRTALKGQILDRKNEKGRLSASIVDFDKFIMELEQKIARYQEERASTVTQRKLIDSEIVSLQTDVDAIEEFLVSAEHQFDSALTAPW